MRALASEQLATRSTHKQCSDVAACLIFYVHLAIVMRTVALHLNYSCWRVASGTLNTYPRDALIQQIRLWAGGKMRLVHMRQQLHLATAENVPQNCLSFTKTFTTNIFTQQR